MDRSHQSIEGGSIGIPALRGSVACEQGHCTCGCRNRRSFPEDLASGRSGSEDDAFFGRNVARIVSARCVYFYLPNLPSVFRLASKKRRCVLSGSTTAFSPGTK